MERFPNVFQNFDYHEPQLIGPFNENVNMRGQWNTRFFKSDKPLTLELACGRGEYTIALAEKYSNRNFIGIDVKGARMYNGAKYALEKNLSNAAFLRTRIEVIETFFEREEVDEIWITFPDPFLKKSKANRRLTHAFFINKYQKFLKKGGLIHLKTDSTPLYDFTLDQVKNIKALDLVHHTSNIYNADLPHPDLDIQTYYEKMHLERGLKIKYIQVRLR